LSSPFLWSPAQRASLERKGLDFLAEFLAIELSHQPENVDALAELGHVYTRLGRLQEGLAVDRRLVRLLPDNPTVHYNLACSLALLGHGDEAFAALEAAVQRGYDDGPHLADDEDLAALRPDPRFQALLARLGVGA
jgi:tetratricopeptide (TPR) repeat protein